MVDVFKNYADEKLSKTNEKYMVTEGSVRISVLTDSLIRVENNKKGDFCDGATQSVLNRNFAQPEFTVKKEGNNLIFTTAKNTFCYSLSDKKMSYIKLTDGKKVTDYHSGNLMGTCRTLDGTDGKTKIGEGVISKDGVAVLDDSKSLLICADGKILPRSSYGEDKYYFAYGHDYINAVRDLFNLTGYPTLIPRYALGNWWSRYKAYTQEEYISLIDRFKAEKIPLTVATIDMDWHWVDIIKRFGKESRDKKKPSALAELFYNVVLPGWTGYSWNTDLFPNPQEFLEYLKANDLKITMNLHPASGCKFFEDAYKDFAEFMGIDPESKEQIYFDITDEKFLEGYFKFLHHPHENAGVDFWWIDWQQGKNTKIPGLDPLWALNHYHSLDIGRNQKRPLILSRFAGAGSHRYPLGFSGDTAQSWATLDFQPYFTANATNIGYTWWSHDIGGHHFGIRDDELYLRWVQLGVFSPIMRLHSTSNEFMGKEPWKYRSHVNSLASDAMRFRHKMLPYIYTMNYRTATEGRALVEPMYYENADDERAYNCPNEYRFGTELIVCPVTKQMDKKYNLAPVMVYLPEGRYTDIFTGRVYNGDAEFEMFRDESSIPVLAKEGAIIPLAAFDGTNNCKNPENLELLIYRGNSSFVLYEDDGETLNYQNGAFAKTKYSVSEIDDNLIFEIEKSEGDLSVIPVSRNYKLEFADITSANEVKVYVDGKRAVAEYCNDNGNLTVKVNGLNSGNSVKIELCGVTHLQNLSNKELKIEVLSKIQGKNAPKAAKYTNLLKDSSEPSNRMLKRIFNEFKHMS